MPVPSATDIRLDRIGQIALTVHDLDRATVFYRDALGMRLLFAVPGMVFFDCGGIRLLLGLPEGERKEADADSQPSSFLYYRVDDIQAAHTALVVRGVSFIREPQLVARMETFDLWLAFFRDPDGNGLALMSEVAR